MPLTPRDKRALMILGGVAAVVAVFLLLFVLKGGGGGGEVAVPTTGPTVAPSPTVSPTPTPRETLPPVVLVGGRDPFSIPPELATTPSGGVSPTTPTSPTSPTTPPPTSPTTPAPTTPSGGSSTTIGGHTVVLVDIFTKDGVQKAQVEVDGTVYTVAEGDEFDDNFKLVSISGDCAQFLFGDESFTLCTNPQK